MTTKGPHKPGQVRSRLSRLGKVLTNQLLNAGNSDGDDGGDNSAGATLVAGFLSAVMEAPPGGAVQTAYCDVLRDTILRNTKQCTPHIVALRSGPSPLIAPLTPHPPHLVTN